MATAALCVLRIFKDRNFYVCVGFVRKLFQVTLKEYLLLRLNTQFIHVLLHWYMFQIPQNT